MSEALKCRMDFFVKDYFEISDQQFTLSEMNQNGRADVTVRVTNPALYIGQFDTKKKCSFLKLQKCADHAIIIKNQDNWELHIIEIKTSVGFRTWIDTIKPQLKSAMLHCRAIAGCLELNINRIVYYTAFENEKFGSNSPNVVVFKQPLGEFAPNALDEWNNDKIYFRFEKWEKFDHKKIQLQRDEESGILIASMIIN